jgi:signal transduction histidine kinase
VPVEVTAGDLPRYPAHVEAAAYFTCLEAVQNAVKHAGATSIHVELRESLDTLVLTVTDDGRGFDTAATPTGAGLANLRDRVEAVGGTVRTESAPGTGTRVHAELPLRAPAPVVTA